MDTLRFIYLILFFLVQNTNEKFEYLTCWSMVRVMPNCQFLAIVAFGVFRILWDVMEKSFWAFVFIIVFLELLYGVLCENCERNLISLFMYLGSV